MSYNIWNNLITFYTCLLTLKNKKKFCNDCILMQRLNFLTLGEKKVKLSVCFTLFIKYLTMK
jgi:hypothetical protein